MNQVESKENKTNCIPPVSLSRNEYGLICDGTVNYVYNDDGTINWRAMIDHEFIVPNREKTDEKDITKLKDSDLLIKLGGLKKLAKIRGYSKVEYDTIVNNGIKGKVSNVSGSSPDIALIQDRIICTTCKITWVPNYETDMQPVTFSSTADATKSNSKSFMTEYLMAGAENRSFVRCVRNFLGIEIVSDEELGDQNVKAGPHKTLESLMEKKGVSFNVIKEKMIAKKIEGADSFKSIDDIPSKYLMSLTGWLAKQEEKS